MARLHRLLQTDRLAPGRPWLRHCLAVLAALACLQASSALAQIVLISVSAPAASSSAVATIAVARPGGVLAGDVMVAVVSHRGGTATGGVVAPTGWTAVSTTDDATRLGVRVYRRVATAAEPATYTWTLGRSERAAGTILAFRGVDTVDPVQTVASSTNAASTAATAPAVTTTSANAMLVSVFSVANGNQTVTPPSSMATAASVATSAGPNGLTLVAAYALQAVAGNTGARVATSTPAQTSIGVTLALRPGAAPPGAGGSFTAFEPATAAGAVSGVIQTKVVDAQFTLAIVALNSTRTGVDTAYTGSATMQMLNASDNTGAIDANGCRSSWTVIPDAGGAVNFASGSNGRVAATLTEQRAWREVRIRILDATGRVGCSTDSFAVRPAALAVSALDTDWQNAWSGDPLAASPRILSNASASGGVVHGAGHPFTLRAVGVNGSGAAISGYDGSPAVVPGSPACVLPSTGCANGVLSFGAWSSVSGGRVATDARYGEAGTFTLLLEDATFAAIDAGDTDAATRTIPQAGGAITVGRFVPAHFDLQPSGPAPLLRTLNTTDASCSAAPVPVPRRSFTYIGQPFGFATQPQATILARNATGGLLANYRGALWKIGPSRIARSIDASATTPAGQPSTVTLGPLTAGNVVANGDGSGTVTGSALDTITFVRGTSAPASPFTAAITADMRVLDDSESGVAGNPALIPTTAVACFNGGGSCAAPGAGIAFDSAVSGFPGNEFRYGRLRLVNANGSELLALPAPALAEYWNGSAWVPNARDFCTTIAPNRVALSNWQRNLQDGETRVTTAGTMAAGQRSIVFLAPGAGNSGSVDLSIDLPAAGLAWLQGAWSGTSYDQNPSARATFGTASAPSPIIFRRERY